MSFTVTVCVDTNDGDYFRENHNMTHDAFEKFSQIVEKIKPLFGKPKNPRIEDYDYREFREYYGQVLTKDELEYLIDHIPVPEPGYASLEDISFTVGSPEYLLSRY
jgi:hypothetical protein